ncbi:MULTISPECIES: hypothetical protein [unclassified Enterococcus]|uniref:hypothetical protein n=1 Tax=unclassified Enterococcus TaxID=2608891 RepID=UPI0015525A4F|nr:MULTISPECIES: hypothetical protein [unclassified Enterococcus]MBS7576962.1 hypothetical protein [Enterococcus sp. MMGLQ5-2]MBS7584369.1 hypothetical protein [Enterococcus sp. MMGLQ5-1]NPD12224.1 hypothetical protein [Enterococcus sp. MMGLQ5-1]NPD36796.1 hypothetical protein [Enterococcus sp. MMGLQ5-2]
MLNLCHEMRKLGFLIGVDEPDYQAFIISLNDSIFYVVEGCYHSKRKEMLYSFSKNYYHKKEGKTQVSKLYFNKLPMEMMIKRVASFVSFMIEKNFFKPLDRNILIYAKEIR